MPDEGDCQIKVGRSMPEGDEDQFTHSNPLLPQGLFIASITPKTPQIKPSIPGTIIHKIVKAFTRPVA